MPAIPKAATSHSMRLTLLPFLPSALALAASLSNAMGDCPSVTPSSTWASTLSVPEDPFEGPALSPGVPGWAKFTILTCAPSEVMFQDGNTYTFHYDFASNQVDPFLGMTPEQYEAVTLYESGREALLGIVMTPPTTSPSGSPNLFQPLEYGVQLVSQDPLDTQLVIDTLQAVQASLSVNPAFELFYFPSFEQLTATQANAALFEANGITISSPARWIEDDTIYSAGWAVGRLVDLPASAVEQAFQQGLLTPTDILLTDSIPADLPLVAGILTRVPASPSSHTALLAQTFGVPFAYLADSSDVAAAVALAGHNVLVRAYSPGDIYGNPAGLRLFDLDAELDASQVDTLRAYKEAAPLAITPTAPLGALGANVDSLGPSDIGQFGGKASNFGLLRDSIPAQSPVAAAISFDLWNGFLDQTLTTGNTLRSEIDAIFALHSWPPADIGLFSAQMDNVRDWIKDDDVTQFTPQQRSDIFAVLTSPEFGFDFGSKLRFRSSTNVEDSAQFTGAGLYDSKSGCLLDDLDGDEVGPSLCDPTETSERGVLRAIRRVFASFYNDNAALERLRHGVSEAEVGMALLVHHSFPDELEIANGVATYTNRPFENELLLVTQVGEVSVANPPDDSLPEQVSIQGGLFGDQVNLLAGSTLLQLGDTVMDWQADYLALRDLIVTVAAEFEARTGKTEYVLDLEYKKLLSGGAALPAGGLVIKQVREIPQPDDTPSVTPFLLNVPYDWCTLQGEGPSVLANHRGKLRLRLETFSQLMTAANLSTGIYSTYELDLTDGCGIHSSSGSMAELPGFSHSYNPAFSGFSTDAWDIADDAAPRRVSLLTTDLPTLVSPARCPVLIQEDLNGAIRTFNTEYENAVLTFSQGGYGEPFLTTEENVALRRCYLDDEHVTIGAPDPIGTPSFDGGSFGIWTQLELQNLSLCTEICAGATAVLHHFKGTTIAGLTTLPIELDSPFSQTFQAGHHNFTNDYLYVPTLEPDLPASTRAELELMDVYAIHVKTGQFGSGGEIQLLSEKEIGLFCSSATPTGCGLNPPGSFFVQSGTPELGGTVVFGVDNPLGTQGQGSIPFVFFGLQAAPGFPCGLPLAGFGMEAPGALGELLVAPSSLIQATLIGPAWLGPGTPSSVPAAIPVDPALHGLTLHAQGLLFDPLSTFGIQYGLTDGMELDIGY